MKELKYEDEYRDGDTGYIWPCGCSQHIGQNISYCDTHQPKTTSISQFASGLQLTDDEDYE